MNFNSNIFDSEKKYRLGGKSTEQTKLYHHHFYMDMKSEG